MSVEPIIEVPRPVEADPPKERRPGGRTRAVALGGLAVAVLGGALASGMLPRLGRERGPGEAAAAGGPPRVTAVTARRMTGAAERVLTGDARPLLDVAIFARATGYLKERYVDIGDRVKAGQLLAVISAPDVDAQLAQAKASLAQAKARLPLAKANLELARITLKRDRRVGDAVPLIQMDRESSMVATTAAQVEVAAASIHVHQAAVQRLTELKGFQKITAPFPGVITARNADPGELITADSPGTSRELFHLMRTDVLRVLVNVPQALATDVKVGQMAAVFRREEPARLFPGKVTRTAGALTAGSRTLLTEVQVTNGDNALPPGMCLQVKFAFDRSAAPVVIPSEALATRSGGPRVAVLDSHNRVHYRSVELGRDDGREVEVLSGLTPGQAVVVRPGDLPEGVVVKPAPAP